jgi:Helix-turn-helix domain
MNDMTYVDPRLQALLANYFTKSEVMATLGISDNTLRKYENQPDGLAYTKIGNRRLYHRDDFEAFLERRKTRPNPTRK